MIKLGNKVRDNITGFTGIAVGRTEWLFGCSRIGIQATELKDGKPVETEWIDEQRVEVIEDLPRVISADSAATSGGPQRDPSRRADIPR